VLWPVKGPVSGPVEAAAGILPARSRLRDR
jgi:hypothetical protein